MLEAADLEAVVFERFTDKARAVIVLAQEEARKFNHNYIGTEHILLGLLDQDESLAATALHDLGVDPDSVRTRVGEIIGYGDKAPAGHIPFTPRAKKVLELSLREALALKHDYIGTEHLLLGLLREGEGVGAQVLVSSGVALADARAEVERLVGERPEAEQRPRAGAALSSILPRPLRMSRDRAEVARLQSEVERLRALLAQHGIDPGAEAS